MAEHSFSQFVSVADRGCLIVHREISLQGSAQVLISSDLAKRITSIFDKKSYKNKKLFHLNTAVFSLPKGLAQSQAHKNAFHAKNDQAML